MGLTKAKKQRIEEEEKYRAKMATRISQNQEKSTSKNVSASADQKGDSNRQIKLFMLFLIVAFFSVSAILLTQNTSLDLGHNPTTKEKNINTDDLLGTINYSSGQFHIINEENIDWEDCWFRVNDKFNYPTNPNTSRLGLVKAGETVSIGAEEFTLKKGTRFNPLTTKPTSLSASCASRFGYWAW